MIRRREFITLLGGAAAAWPLAARGQQSERVRRIGVLMGIADSPEGQRRVAAFQEGLLSLGWMGGRNAQLDIRWAAGDKASMRAHAQDLINKSSDIIVVNGTQTASVLLGETRSLPVVFVQVSDPIASGLVTGLARPGGNVTGFYLNEDALVGKWLELLKETVQDVTNVAAILSSEDPAWAGYLRTIEAAATPLGVQIFSAVVRDALEIEQAIEAIARKPNGGLVVQPTSLTTVHHERIISLAARHRLPAVYPLRLFATSGGLMAYGADNIDQYRKAAAYVDRILKGEKPGNLPVQQPTKFELVINLKTAKAVGLNIPPLLLARADEVIE
jgi:putative tryptophan/tyrosine transport system substrate-binding protein